MFNKKPILVVRGGTSDRPYTMEQMQDLETRFVDVKGFSQKIFVRGDSEVTIIK